MLVVFSPFALSPCKCKNHFLRRHIFHFHPDICSSRVDIVVVWGEYSIFLTITNTSFFSLCSPACMTRCLFPAMDYPFVKLGMREVTVCRLSVFLSNSDVAICQLTLNDAMLIKYLKMSLENVRCCFLFRSWRGSLGFFGKLVRPKI